MDNRAETLNLKPCGTAHAPGILPDAAGAPTGTPLSDPPLVEMISEDPVLRGTKLIAEAWDCDGLNQACPGPALERGRSAHFRLCIVRMHKICL